MKTVSQQIADIEATRAAKVARNEKITAKAAEEGRSLDEAEREEMDTNADEIEALDEDLVRLRRLEKQIAGAKPLQRGTGTRPEPERRAPHIEIVEEKVDKGIRLARFARAMLISKMDVTPIADVAKHLYEYRDPALYRFVKDAVAAGSTLSGNWAANLVGEETNMFADFVEFLMPMTILGRFGNDGIPSLNRVPFRVPLISETDDGDGYWVGEGKPKPLTKFGYDRTTLLPLKVANIVALTMELVRDSSPAADVNVRNAMARALRKRLDTDFIDPAKIANTPAASPASITNGIAAIPSSGNTADAVRADVKAVFSAFIAANNTPDEGVWIMPNTVALALSLMTTELGTPEFPGITMRGGTFQGLPVIASQYVPTVSAGSFVFLVNASDIYFGDDGDIRIDMSREASLEMSDTPTQDQPSGVSGSSLVSLWQNNLVGFLAERTVNWKRRRESAVAALDEVNWGDLST